MFVAHVVLVLGGFVCGGSYLTWKVLDRFRLYSPERESNRPPFTSVARSTDPEAFCVFRYKNKRETSGTYHKAFS